MNFIWDIVLNAKRHGTDEPELFFQPAKECSPWYEQSFPVLNETKAEGPRIEYNPLYRFDAIFHDLLRDDLLDWPMVQDYLFDAASHLLVQVDLHHGLTRRAFYVRCLMRELEGGGFGPSVAGHIRTVDPDRRERLSSLALTQLQAGSSLLLFRKAVALLFPDALLYQERCEPKQLLLYLAEKKDERLEHHTRLVEELFLPISHRLRVFWEHHFGVIGVDATMHTGNIELY